MGTGRIADLLTRSEGQDTGFSNPKIIGEGWNKRAKPGELAEFKIHTDETILGEGTIDDPLRVAPRIDEEEPEALGVLTPTGIERVYTDSTLGGLGTAQDPLFVANPFTEEDEQKLDDIERFATQDQTASEIKTLLESLPREYENTETGLIDDLRLDVSAVKNALSTEGFEVRHDSTLTGTGQLSDPLVVTHPLRDAEVRKLTQIPDPRPPMGTSYTGPQIELGATQDQTPVEIRDLLVSLIPTQAQFDEGIDERLPLSAIRGDVGGLLEVYHNNTLLGRGTEDEPLGVNPEEYSAFTEAEKTKLAGIEDRATRDQSGSEIVTLLHDLRAEDKLVYSRALRSEGRALSVKYDLESLIPTESDVLAGIDNRLDVSAVKGAVREVGFRVYHDESLTGEGIQANLLSVVDVYRFSQEERVKLAGIETGATADQSAEEMRVLLESLVGEERLSVLAIKDLPEGGLLAVTSDETLQGAGTSANPLTVSPDVQFNEIAKTKLAGIEADATRDQTASEMRILLESLTGEDKLDASAIKNLPGEDIRSDSRVTVSPSTVNSGYFGYSRSATLGNIREVLGTLVEDVPNVSEMASNNIGVYIAIKSPEGDAFFESIEKVAIGDTEYDADKASGVNQNALTRTQFANIEANNSVFASLSGLVKVTFSRDLSSLSQVWGRPSYYWYGAGSYDHTTATGQQLAFMLRGALISCPNSTDDPQNIVCFYVSEDVANSQYYRETICNLTSLNYSISSFNNRIRECILWDPSTSSAKHFRIKSTATPSTATSEAYEDITDTSTIIPLIEALAGGTTPYIAGAKTLYLTGSGANGDNVSLNRANGSIFTGWDNIDANSWFNINFLDARGEYLLTESTVEYLRVVHTDDTLEGLGTIDDPLTIADDFSSAEKTKLASIETGATADQSAGEIKDLLETLIPTQAQIDQGIDHRLDGSAVKNIEINRLSDIDDVSSTVTPSNRYALLWNGLTSKWEPAPVHLTGGTINHLNDILDVNAPAPTDNQALVWNQATLNWIPGEAISGSGGGFESVTEFTETPAEGKTVFVSDDYDDSDGNTIPKGPYIFENSTWQRFVLENPNDFLIRGRVSNVTSFPSDAPDGTVVHLTQPIISDEHITLPRERTNNDFVYSHVATQLNRRRSFSPLLYIRNNKVFSFRISQVLEINPLSVFNTTINSNEFSAQGTHLPVSTSIALDDLPSSRRYLNRIRGPNTVIPLLNDHFLVTSNYGDLRLNTNQNAWMKCIKYDVSSDEWSFVSSIPLLSDFIHRRGTNEGEISNNLITQHILGGFVYSGVLYILIHAELVTQRATRISFGNTVYSYYNNVSYISNYVGILAYEMDNSTGNLIFSHNINKSSVRKSGGYANILFPDSENFGSQIVLPFSFREDHRMHVKRNGNTLHLCYTIYENQERYYKTIAYDMSLSPQGRLILTRNTSKDFNMLISEAHRLGLKELGLQNSSDLVFWVLDIVKDNSYDIGLTMSKPAGETVWNDAVTGGNSAYAPDYSYIRPIPHARLFEAGTYTKVGSFWQKNV